MPRKQKMLQRCGIRYLGFPLRLPVHYENEATAFSKLRLLTQLKSPIFSFPQISQTNAIP
jgi:hypothetical protein